MDKTIKKIITIIVFAAFVLQLILPLKDAQAMTAPWWNGSQGTGSTNVGSGTSAESNLQDNSKNQCSVAEPVFIHNGDYVYDTLDLLIPSRGMNTEIRRIYKSQSRYNNRFGYGWDMFYNKRIVPLCNGDIHYLNGKLNRYTFKYIDGTNYISPKGIYDTIVQNTDGTFTLTEPHKTTFTFDQNGVLIRIRDRNYNTLTFTYDSAGKLPIIGKSIFSNDPNPKVIAYDYKLTKITDTVNRDLILNYDAHGRLTTITDFSGRVYTYYYDPSVNGDLLSFTTPPTAEYPQGLTATYAYDVDHNLKTITDAKNQTYLTNSYDTNDKVYQQDYGQGKFNISYDTYNQTTVTDPKSFVTEWIYDPYGHPTSKKEFTKALRPTDPPYYNTTYSYNNNLELTNTTYAENNGIKYTYDESNSDQLSRGNLLELRRKMDMAQQDYNQTDIVTAFTYEPNFNFIKTSTDPRGYVTTYTYDYELPPSDPNYAQKGNLVKITYPQVAGQTPETKFTYNQFGQLETVTDPNNNTTRYEYYPNTGYLSKIIQDPNGLNYTTEFTYDSAGNPLSVKNSRGHTTIFQFNQLNQLTNSTSPAPFNYQTKYSYDENGNLEKLERQTNEPQNPWQTTQYSYTALDQLESIKQYTSPAVYLETKFTYDLNGNRSSVIDANNKTTTYQFDERNLIWKTTDSLNYTTEYTYDPNGNLSITKDSKLNETKYDYDDFDRLQKSTYADSSFKQFGYDKNSNLTNFTNPSNQAITYTYDALNRLDLKTYPDASTVDYIYDLGSRLTNVHNPNAQITYLYDNANRITQTTQTVNSTLYAVNYQYDEVSNRTKLTTPNGLILNYEYDELNRLTQISNLQSTICNYSYDSLSRRIRLFLGNNTFTNYEYDSLNRLTNLSNKACLANCSSLGGSSGGSGGSGGAAHPRPFLGPPVLSTPLAKTQPISDFDYTYDNVGNRLTMTTGAGADNYTYDTTYQLTNVSGAQTHSYQYDAVGNRQTADAITYTPNNLNQYSDVGGVTYTNDANGNLTSDGTNTYTYDVENRLITATTPSNNATYTYDGLGRRISKTVNGTTTYFIYDGDQIIEERDTNGSLLANYVYGSEIDEVLRMTRNNQDYYYHYDGLGSVTDITDSTNTVVESYSYDVYGMPSQLSTIGNRFYFTGRELDSETGLYFYRSRNYSPTIGRFLQRDEWPGNLLDPSSMVNKYTYCGNNPINWVDPWGFLKNLLLEQDPFFGGFSSSDKKCSSRDDKSLQTIYNQIKDSLPSNAVPPFNSFSGPPYPDEFTREDKWWEWIIWIIKLGIHAYFLPPETPGIESPVPPNHKDWPGYRKPKSEDYVT